MSFIQFYSRGSGRTSRMLEDAINQASKGRAVYILCPNDIRYHQRLAAYICQQKNISPDVFNGLKFETIASIGERNINWERREMLGAHPNCKLFIDHHVFAQKFSYILDGFHEYDATVIINKDHLKMMR